MPIRDPDDPAVHRRDPGILGGQASLQGLNGSECPVGGPSAVPAGEAADRSKPPLSILILVTAIAPAALHMLVPSLPLLAAVFD
ncbi:MAG: hypothetical protein J2P48_21295, partial [Alphaproteobacteria bacterium]|nr:hypothetical protein [Alphaproteobacteria bacterium]